MIFPITKRAVRDVSYAGYEYVIYRIPFNDTYVLFVIDAEDRNNIDALRWHLTSNRYIGSTIYDDGKKKELYVHNLIMGILDNNGRGQPLTVDHINRIPADNRKANLRNNMTQTEQNFNQRKRNRTEDVSTILQSKGIDPTMIPKCVWYVKPEGNFGEHFEMHVKQLPGFTRRPKSSKSVNYSLVMKLEEMKKYLRELIDMYPSDFEIRNNRYKYSELDLKLIKEYNQIIELSGLDTDNICKVDTTNIDYLAPIDPSLLTHEERKYLESCSLKLTPGSKGKGLKIPDDSGVDPSMIPMYVSYTPAKGNRGDKFIIDRHPLSTTRSIGSSGSQFVSTKDKFVEILLKLREIEKTTNHDQLIVQLGGSIPESQFPINQTQPGLQSTSLNIPIVQPIVPLQISNTGPIDLLLDDDIIG